MKEIAPCKKCEKRTATCHSDCEEYTNWKKRLDEHKSICKTERNKDAEYKEYKRKKTRKELSK